MRIKIIRIERKKNSKLKKEEEKLMKICKTFFLVTVLLAVSSSNVFAMESEEQTVFHETTMEDSLEEEAEIFTMEDFNTNVSAELKAGMNSQVKKFTEMEALYATGTTYTPDQYEPNNNSGVATSGIKGKKIQANINTANDEDWYKIDVTQSDLDESQGLIAVILTDIPANYDYDLFILKIMSNGQMGQVSSEQTGNTSETIYLQGEPGTYYAVVDPKNGIDNNYSPQNYSFYFGGAYKNGSTGYMNLGMKFDFGTKNYGSNGPWLSPYQQVDLSSVSFIPDQALISKLYISDNSNGAYWIGFYKMVNGIEQMGNSSAPLDIAENQYLAKELYQIQGKITRSDGFIWEPQLRIDYIYPITIQNLRFISQ